jgi:hypothetical protein
MKKLNHLQRGIDYGPWSMVGVRRPMVVLDNTELIGVLGRQAEWDTRPVRVHRQAEEDCPRRDVVRFPDELESGEVRSGRRNHVAQPSDSV